MANPDFLFFDDDGRTPNNRWPVVIHHTEITASDLESAARLLEQRLNDNAWPAQWRGGVFNYHHYHSNAHEVLAVARGTALLVLGGENGQALRITPGDVVILPAGVGHRRRSASDDFCLVAGYPATQQNWDLCEVGRADIKAARRRIQALPCPATDPITGTTGGLLAHWRA